MSRDVARNVSTGVAWKRLYFFASCASLLSIAFVISYAGDNNLPPLQPLVRHFILALYLNLAVAYVLWIRDLRIREVETLHATSLLRQWPLFGAVAFLLCFTPPVFSGDLHYFLMRGRILGMYQDSPYAHVPAEYPGDILLPTIWMQMTDPYGPLSAYFQTLPCLLFPNSKWGMILAYKAQLLFLWGVSVVYFWRIVKECLPGGDTRLWILYAYSPLILVFAGIDGHNDAGLMAISVISVYYLLKHSYGRAFFFWTCAFAFKYVVLLQLPFYLLFIAKAEARFPWKRIFAYFLLNIGFFALLFFPLWAGPQSLDPLLKAADWFYSSSIPYAFQQGLRLLGVELHWKFVKVLFLAGYTALTVGLLMYQTRSEAGDTVVLFRCFALIYLGFYASLVSPLAAWYWLWAFPWLILAQWPKNTLLVLLYSAVALLAFYKRINYLTLIAAAIYAVALVLWYSGRRVSLSNSVKNG